MRLLSDLVGSELEDMFLAIGFRHAGVVFVQQGTDTELVVAKLVSVDGRNYLNSLVHHPNSRTAIVSTSEGLEVMHVLVPRATWVHHGSHAGIAPWMAICLSVALAVAHRWIALRHVDAAPMLVPHVAVTIAARKLWVIFHDLAILVVASQRPHQIAVTGSDGQKTRKSERLHHEG